MARSFAVAVGAAVGALLLALTACTASPAPQYLGSASEYARALFDGVNEERDSAGLSQLVWNDCLAEKAQPRAQATIGEDQLEHEPLFATCLSGVAAGENLSKGAFTAREIVDMWMASAGHAANILKPDFTDAGASCVPASGEASGETTGATTGATTGETTGAATGETSEHSSAFACSLLFEGGS